MIILFLLLCFGVALWMVMPVFLRRYHQNEESSQSFYRDNVAAARERKQQLHDAVEAGEITLKQAEEYTLEIEKTLLRDVENQSLPTHRNETEAGIGKRDWLGGGIVVLTLLLIIPPLYVFVGTPEKLMNIEEDQNLSENIEQPEDIEALIKRLEHRISEVPEDAEALYWLGRISATKQDHKAAVDYYQRAFQYSKETPSSDFFAAYIDALIIEDAFGNKNKIEALLAESLERDSSHSILLWLAGVHAEIHGDLEKALGFWRQAYTSLADFPEGQQDLLLVITDAEQRLNDTVKNNEGLVVVVRLASELSVADDAVLFVFAKAAGDDAPPIPLAVHRQTQSAFPLTVNLNDSMAMVENLKMSQFSAYNINARLSGAGNVEARSGDLYGVLESVLPQSTVTITINKIVQ